MSRAPTAPIVTRVLRAAALLAFAAAASVGCASGARGLFVSYQPVMTVKARAPVPVTLPPFSVTADDPNNKTGRVRNPPDATAVENVRQAYLAELAQAGFTFTNTAAAAAAPTGGVVVRGTVGEFATDLTMGGYDTRLRARVVVTRDGVTRLDREYAIRDGGSGLTGSRDEYRTVINAALTKLMRKSVPDVIAAIQD
jgi:hypothetical protein